MNKSNEIASQFDSNNNSSSNKNVNSVKLMNNLINTYLKQSFDSNSKLKLNIPTVIITEKIEQTDLNNDANNSDDHSNKTPRGNYLIFYYTKHLFKLKKYLI